MNTALVILILASLVDIFIGLVVIFRNYHKPANVAFGLTSFALVAWAGLDFFSTYQSNPYALLVTRFTGFFGVLLITSFFALSLVFPSSLKFNKRLLYGMAVVLPIICVLCLTNLFIASRAQTASGFKLISGTLYPLYSLTLLFMFAVCNINFIKQYRHARKLARGQLKLMWLGIASTVVLILSSNVLIPALTNNWSSSRYGTIFTIPFVAITAYAIVKQRMFDLRLIITRTIAYAITISFVALLYAYIVIIVTTRLADIKSLAPSQIIALVVPALFIALSFQRIQGIIDRLTQRIFYRDAYELHDVLDQLSDTLLVENDIDAMMSRSLGVLYKALKPTGAYLAVVNTSGVIYKHLQIANLSATNPTPFLTHLKSMHRPLIEASESSSYSIIKLMNDRQVEIMLRLGSSHQPTGILLLGPKSNGSIYSSKDISLLNIGAKNLGIALDNAKKYEEIIHFADTLHKEVKGATAHLRLANDKLKSLDALKDDFISTASHQLRSPAVSVHDALRMLNFPNMTAKDRKEMLLLAEASSERLVTVVRTMLNMSRIQSGHFTIDTSEADLDTLVNHELSQLRALSNAKKITITYQPPATPIIATVDVAKINEAIANYVENAIKYSSDGAAITVSLSKEDGMIRFEVSDQGMGVPLGEREKLFGRFYRATNARKEEPDGNGIGLYVVKMIAEGHGGEAYYRPRTDNGSVFGFTLKARP